VCHRGRKIIVMDSHRVLLLCEINTSRQSSGRSVSSALGLGIFLLRFRTKNEPTSAPDNKMVFYCACRLHIRDEKKCSLMVSSCRADEEEPFAPPPRSPISRLITLWAFTLVLCEGTTPERKAHLLFSVVSF
jgi:hypothetical protein